MRQPNGTSENIFKDGLNPSMSKRFHAPGGKYLQSSVAVLNRVVKLIEPADHDLERALHTYGTERGRSPVCYLSYCSLQLNLIVLARAAQRKLVSKTFVYLT